MAILLAEKLRTEFGADFDYVVLSIFTSNHEISYLLMHNWLQGYNYRTEVSWWIFALTGVLTVTISLMTVSYQSIKTAMINPIKRLRSK